MRYDIRLQMGTRYGAPAARARTLMRLLPKDVPGRQRVTARALSIDPTPDERRELPDFFGNAATLLSHHTAIDRITATLRVSAETLHPMEGLDLSPDLPGLLSEVAQHRGLGNDAPLHFLGPSPRLPHAPQIAAFAKALPQDGRTARQIVALVGAALHHHMRFDPEATDVETPPVEAFLNGHGVCQDFAQIMITALRALGVPAGYVSGFLRTVPPPGQARLEGADAMHAWVWAWCGAETGWVEYDPTNACFAATDHIVVARGRDYGDASPIKAVLSTFGAQESFQSVDVRPLDAPAPAERAKRGAERPDLGQGTGSQA